MSRRLPPPFLSLGNALLHLPGKPEPELDYCGQIEIGITGHLDLADPESVARGIDAALDGIYERIPFQPYLLSTLAPGTEQLAAVATLWRGGAVEAVLPLRESELANDCPDDESKRVFWDLLFWRVYRTVSLPPQPTREAALEAAAGYILENSKVLLAVWDGAPPRASWEPGAMIERARAMRRAVARVHAGATRDRSVDPANAPTPDVTYEGFDGYKWWEVR